MTISKEAYTYLHELEKVPNWSTLPNDDDRIRKLHLHFGVDLTQIKYTKTVIYNVYQRGRLVATGTSEECANKLGIKKHSIYAASTPSAKKKNAGNRLIAYRIAGDTYD